MTRQKGGRRVVTVALGHEALRVKINGLVHLHIEQEKLTGFQAWEKGRPATSWLIEFSTTTGPILAEYAERTLWAEILQGLEVALRA